MSPINWCSEWRLILSAIPSPSALYARFGRSSWYPFYPGFSDSFSSAIPQAASHIRVEAVLDSWNSAGTTTASAAQLGLGAVGIDLNPAMVVAARSRRLLDPLDGPTCGRSGAQILQVARSTFSEELDSDPCPSFLATRSPGAIRAIELAIRDVSWLIQRDCHAVRSFSRYVSARLFFTSLCSNSL